jgi:WXG100 family type VII secretion target
MTHTPAGQVYGQGEGTLTRGAGMVTEARADLTAISARLTDQLGALRGAWAGRGATSFQALQQAWTDQQHTVVRVLDDLASALGATEQTNVSTDETQGASFGRLSGRLGGAGVTA